LFLPPDGQSFPANVHRAIKRLVVAARVNSAARRRDEWKIPAPKYHASPQAIAGLTGDISNTVNQSLNGEIRLWQSEATVRAGGRLVRHGAGDVNRLCGDLVRSRQRSCGDECGSETARICFA